MSSPQGISFAFPRPKRTLWIVMIAMVVLGVFTAFLGSWLPGGRFVFNLLGYEPEHTLTQPWRLLTSGLLTSYVSWSHLLFSLVGLYFLGAPLEARWGSWRFARFLALSVILGNLTVLALSTAVPAAVAERFHPGFLFGPTAAIAAVAVAWSREYASSTVNLFFVVPVRGKVLFWVTLAFCVLDLIYPEPIPEGAVAPFGGVIAGLVFGGTPSLARTAWLRLRLLVLRRQASAVQVEDVLSTAKPKRRPRAGAPPLRVVSGGLEEVLKKRTPPKDKRYLN